MSRRAKTVSINLRLPADLHKALVEAGSSNSPPTSLNSEILSRLYESFERPSIAELAGVKAHALAQIKHVESHALDRMQEVERRADELNQLMESRLAELDELKRRAEGKSK